VKVRDYLLGFLLAGAVWFIILWSLMETDPQYRTAPEYVQPE